MAADERPFADILYTEDGFSIPDLKWRELLFVGALRPVGAFFVRNPKRPLPPFSDDNLFPEGMRFKALLQGGRVVLKPAGPDVP